MDDEMNFYETYHVAISKLDKEQIVKKLVEFRKDYFARDKDARGRHEAIAIAAFDKKHPGLSNSSRLTDLYKYKMSRFFKSQLY
jgi:hypothetical protein